MILVTGATGFIGRVLVKDLLASGHRVRVACRKSDPEYAECPDIELCNVGSIGPDTDWRPALHDIDIVIHLAGVAHVLEQSDHADEDFTNVNALGTKKLVEDVAGNPGITRFIFISSIGVIAEQSPVPINERSPCNPSSAYGRSKLAAERYIESILADSVTDWVIIRPTLVYGKDNPGNMSRLIKFVDSNIPLPIGAISGSRSFVYVKNLTRFILVCLSNKQASRNTFVISDNEPLTVVELVQLIASSRGKKVQVFHVPVPLLRILAKLGDAVKGVFGKGIGIDTYSMDKLTGSLVVDSSHAKEVLSWLPPYTTQEAIRESFRDMGE